MAIDAGRLNALSLSSVRKEVDRRVLAPIAFKAVPLSAAVVDFKVGIFRSGTRIGKLTQAAGSAVLPGDTSKLRNPVRSTARRAVTPGLGGSIGGERERMRCPAGYEHGGRFTGRSLAGCGVHLFSPARQFNGLNVSNPRSGRTAGSAAAGGSRTDRLNINNPPAGEATARILGGDRRIGSALAVSRSARIPDVGPANAARQRAAIRKAAGISSKDSESFFLVRRDGYTLSPNSNISVLMKYGKQSDMDGATLVVPGLTPDLGDKELPLLFSTRLKAVVFALPDGKTATISKTRDIKPSEAAGLPAAWKNRVNADGLQTFAKGSGGVFKFEYSGASADQAEIRVRPQGGGASRMVPRWVYNTFLSSDAPGRASNKAWIVVRD